LLWSKEREKRSDTGEDILAGDATNGFRARSCSGLGFWTFRSRQATWPGNPRVDSANRFPRGLVSAYGGTTPRGTTPQRPLTALMFAVILTLLGAAHERSPGEGRIFMKLNSKEKQIGARVRVHEKRCTRRPHLHGMVGRIGHRYGVAGCATLEVWFSEGQAELFSEHDLVKAG
jgi:hypothetical protein